ncbi:hypothetical protein [Acinetobacter sp.]|uniref:hypothetical protein n=1 Tax=Acinetobacter sp. TaxID=472 RepID=UPI0035B4CF27
MTENLFFEIEEASNLNGSEIENTIRLTKLFQNESDSYQLSSSGNEVIFNNNLYITTIGFHPENSNGTFELTYKNILGFEKKLNCSQTNQHDRIVFAINDGVKSFKIKFEKASLSFKKKSNIDTLRVIGHSLKTITNQLIQFNKVNNDRENYAEKINTLKAELQETLNEVQNKRIDFETLLKNKAETESELNDEITRLSAEKKIFAR